MTQNFRFIVTTKNHVALNWFAVAAAAAENYAKSYRQAVATTKRKVIKTHLPFAKD